jgi:tetratricopeptide (TPR) repeat protein
MKKQRHAPAPRLASPDVLEKRGAEDLKQGRFKDAMEAFRQLVKIEPRPEWRQSLARAYVGRGRTLAAKGMYKEAPLLFDNAAGVDGAFHEPLIHLTCLVRTGDTDKAARLCARMLEDGAKLLTELVEAERRGSEQLLDALLKHTGRFPPGDLRAACLNLLPLAPKRIPRFERQFGPLSSLEHHRVLALAAEQTMNWESFESHWSQYAYELTNSTDPDAALSRSVIYRHMADTAAKALDIRPRSGDDPVAEFLEMSVEADPDDREGLLKLIARLRDADRIKERDRWAELAVTRFPDDPAALTEALEAAAQRGAFRKAAELAGKLLKVDPINPLARQRMIELRIAHARKKLREGRADLAGKELEDAARHERRDAPDGVLMIVRGLLAVHMGRTEEGWADVRAGVARLGGGVAGWLRAVLEAHALGFQNKDIKPAGKELSTVQSVAPTAPALIAVLGVLNRREFREGTKLSDNGLKAIRPWLKRGADCVLSDAEFQTVAETFDRLQAFDLLSAYAEAAIRRGGGGQPLAEFYRIFAAVKGNAVRLSPFQITRLEDIIDQVTQRKDLGLAYKIMDFLDQGLPPSPFGNLPFDELDEDDFLDLPPPGGIFPGSPFGDLDEGDDAGITEVTAIVDRATELLRTHGRSETIDIVMREYGDSPMVKGLPKGLVRALIGNMLDLAEDAGIARPASGKRAAARRRKRGGR